MTDTRTQDGERLLGVFAHPDDETLGAGALLALAARAGHDVSVVTCTRGERGQVIPEDLAHLRDDGAGLAAQREGELSEALAALGVERHLYLDQVPALERARPARFLDSGMTWTAPGIAGPAPDSGPEAFSRLDVDVAATLLAVVIRHLRPTTVLTEEPGGGYGHPDHVQAHRVTMRALELAAAPGGTASGSASAAPGTGPADDPLAGLDPWTVPALAWVAQSEPDMRAAAEELCARARRVGPPPGADGAPLTLPEALLAPGAALPSLLVPASDIDAVLDARAVVPELVQAMRAHRSQVQSVALVERVGPLAGRFALANGMVQPLLSRAYLRLAPGYGPVPTAWAAMAGAADPASLHDHEGVGVREPAELRDEDRVEGAGRVPAFDDVVHGGERRDDPGPRRITRTRTRPSSVNGPLPYTTPVAALLGVVVAVLGTVVHRWEQAGRPTGMVLALAGVLAAATAARALAGAGGLLVMTLAVVVVTQAMTFVRPGGDVLVTGEALSYVWLFGAPLVCVVAAVLPRRWFAAVRRPARRGADEVARG
ncbi:PIG-L family deacetylase [Georgenia sp. MJ206]|uniref:PIG-L family deacetylase n=1 Tax=Georgenia wangjunii TaxID=3117730 RepID=UPI002F261899